MRAGWRPAVRLWPVLAISAFALVAAAWVPEQFDLAAITLVPFALLVAVAAGSDLERRPSFLRARPLVALGKVSFAFFLTHCCVILVFGAVVSYHPGHLASDVAVAALLLACSVATAFALNRWVERPLERRLRGRPRPERQLRQPVTAGPQPIAAHSGSDRQSSSAAE
jgi:peptidoglycan/LPS O-acetylase OafA/YrhL